MAPKGSSTNVTPSTILADAVNAFTKAASLAIAAVEEQARLDVAQVNADLAEMRRERDKNMKFMSQTQLQEKDWERHGEMLKTSLEKSELTIKHQAETVLQLRDEVAQWKNQLSRLEQTSRREIQDWKEQYLRAEQERSRLSSRIDELVAEQLQNATQQAVPRGSTYRLSEAVDVPAMRRRPSNVRKPRPSMPEIPSDSEEAMPPPLKVKSKPIASQAGTDRERTYVEMPSPKESARDPPARIPKRPIVDLPSKKSSPHKAPPAPRASTSRTDLHGPYQPQQNLIRRVHAVVEVPVKEEVYSDEENALASEESEWEPEKKTVHRRRRRSSVKSKPYVEIDEEEDVNENEDDQLLIGAEDNPNEIYGTQRVIVAEEVRPKQRPRAKGSSSSTNKKRKLDTDSSAAGRISTTKVARKKP